MPKRRVLFCTQTASPIGGVETLLDAVARSLKSEPDWEPVIGLVRGAKAHLPEKWTEVHSGFRTVEIDGRGMTAEGRIRAICRCIRRVDPDVFVPLSIVDAYDAICRIKADGGETRLLMSVHGNVPVMLADMRRYASFADMVVCPGALTCRMAREWAGVPADRVRHIPNGADSPTAQWFARPEGAPIRLGYVGRIMQHDKRVLDLPPICESLKTLGVPFSLVVAGDGPVTGDLERGFAEAGVSDHVRMLGRLSVDAIYRMVYPNLDCLLLMSDTEAFGIVLAEAMLHGVVPVSSRFLGHRSEGLVRYEENALLFNVGDTDAAAEQVARLAGDDPLRAELARRGMKESGERYTWERCLAGWRSAFRDVVRTAPVTGGVVPERDLGPQGKLDRHGVPPGAIDLLRRMRRALLGVPSCLVGGEEWPVHARDNAPELVKEAECVARELDLKGGVGT